MRDRKPTPLIWRAGQILRSDLVRKPGLRKSDPGNPPLDLGERTPKSGSKGGGPGYIQTDTLPSFFLEISSWVSWPSWVIGGNRPYYPIFEKYKIGYISEDRKKEGLILIHNVLDNASITIWSQIKQALSFVTDPMITKKVNPYLELLEVKTPSNYQIISNLSGGNQQKISVAKWLAAGTDILIIDEPTVGIDIKTKAYLHELIIKLAENGTSIILISSDMPEMIGLADRIIVMKDFAIKGEVINDHDYDSMSASIMEYIHD